MRRSLAVLVACTSLALLPAAAPASDPDLSISVADRPDPVTVGSDLGYTLTVENAGPEAATDVTVHDTFPQSVSFAYAAPSRGTCTHAPGNVDCALGTLAAGQRATVDILVAPLAPGTLQNSAAVSTTGTDPDPSNDTATTDTSAEGSACTMIGTWKRDHLTGTDGPDVLCGLGQDDTLDGGVGDDVLYGGSATDLLFGGDGDDRLEGGDEGDFLTGAEGNDVLLGGPGVNTCLQGDGTGPHDCPGRTRSDRNDTRGRFDMSRAILIRKGPGSIAVRVRTFATWKAAGVWDFGYFIVFLDSVGDAAPDYYALIRSDRSRMEATLYRKGSGRDATLRRLPVRKLGGNTVAVTIPLGRLSFGPGRGYFRWSVQSIWNEAPCKGACFDQVDDAGPIPDIR